MQAGAAPVLVDSGDGAADQIEKAGVDLGKVRTVILSHLHLDRTAGLYGIIGRRLQQHIPGELRIHGPPGSRQVVEAITASQTYVADLMAPTPRPGASRPPPSRSPRSPTARRSPQAGRP